MNPMGKLNFLQSCLMLIIFLSCSSCSKQPQDIKYSDTLTIAVDLSIKEIKPFLSVGLAGALSELLYPPLFSVDSKEELEGFLAEKLVIEEGGAKVRVFLSKVHADDVKRSFEKAKALNLSKVKSALTNLVSIDIVSEKEIVFNLRRYDRLFLLNLSEINIIAFSGNDPTTGEFKVSKQTKDYVVFERKIPHPKKTNFIKVITIPSYHQAIKAAMKGEVDLLLSVGQGDYELLKSVSNLKLQKLSTRLIYAIFQNQTRHEKNLNLNTIGQKVRGLNFSKIYGSAISAEIITPVPVDSLWYDADLEKELWEQAYFQTFDNLKHEGSLDLTFANFQPRQERLANFLKNSLKESGLNIKLDSISDRDFYQKIVLEKDFDFFLGHLNFTRPFVGFYNFFYSSGLYNYVGYQSQKVDTYLDKARYSQKLKAAKIYFNLAMKEIMKAPPGVFLFWTETPIVFRKGCINVPSNATELFIRLPGIRCPQVENMMADEESYSNENSDFFKLFLAFIIFLPLYHFLTSPKRMLKKMVGDQWPK